MEIEVKAEKDDGSVVFEGTLTHNEVNFVLNVGINYLLAKGSFPFTKEAATTDIPETLQ